MKIVAPLLLLSLAFAGCVTRTRPVTEPTLDPRIERAVGPSKAGADPALERMQARLPEPVRDTWLGMPLEEFKRVKDTSSMEPYDGFEFRKELTEVLEEGPVQDITYYFDVSEPGQPLYEYIVEYREGEDVDARAVALLGPPNEANDRWLLPDLAAFPIRAWIFEQKIVVIGVMPGTEYDPRDE